jgi:translation initiation factor IF-3
VITIYKISLALPFICAILDFNKFIFPKKEGTWQKQKRQNVLPKLPKGKSARMLQPENQNSAQHTRKNNVGL